MALQMSSFLWHWPGKLCSIICILPRHRSFTAYSAGNWGGFISHLSANCTIRERKGKKERKCKTIQYVSFNLTKIWRKQKRVFPSDGVQWIPKDRTGWLKTLLASSSTGELKEAGWLELSSCSYSQGPEKGCLQHLTPHCFPPPMTRSPNTFSDHFLWVLVSPYLFRNLGSCSQVASISVLY